MIKKLECFENGALGQMSVEDVCNHVKKRLLGDIVRCDMPKLDTLCVEDYHGWINDLFCNKKEVVLNDKNLEYSEGFWVVKDCVFDGEVGKALEFYDISDIRVNVFVYRLGSYSYWMAMCEIYTENDPKCAG